MDYKNIIINSQNELDFFNNFKNIKITFNDLLLNIKHDVIVLTKLLILLKINNDLFYSLLETIKRYNSCNEYKRTYCIEYNLILILQVKNNANNWPFLQKLSICDGSYKNVYNQYCRWNKKGIFEDSFYNFTLNLNLQEQEDLLIDASSFSNKYGSENVTINSEYTKKNITKLSVITTKQGAILSIKPFEVNSKKIIYNKKEKIIKTTEHDSKTIQKSVDLIKNKIEILNIIGDKGYKTSNIITKNAKKINIITPNKKNQKNNLNTMESNLKMKGRYKIENIFGIIKMNNERIMLRKDKSLINFMGWVYIASLENNLKFLIKR
jgi:hypothetical protein